METIIVEIIKSQNVATILVAMITFFIMRMSRSLQKIEKDMTVMNQSTLLFQQKTNMRLNSLEREIKASE